MTIKSFKRDMITKAKARGCIWENFGQKELSKLKDKYNYNDLLISNDCLSKKDINNRNDIDELNEWAMIFNLT